MSTSDEKDKPAPLDGSGAGVEKTYVEDLTDTGTFTRLAPGTRIHAASLGNTNPYALQRFHHYDELPRADERVQLGSGVVAGILGDGGMARVYKIWNQKLEVFRAVKILLPDQSESIRKRFETEAKITAKLRHPNIVEIHTVGEYNGLPFIEMELVEGMSLEKLIATHGRMPPAVCSSIGIAIADALAYAHGVEVMLYGTTYKGVIHRDLKPANIMVAGNGTVKLMDFGIARPADASLHTAEGSIVGTMQYLSPEQLDGADVDCRTDIYSFGAILYEVLTGTKTFPQNTITTLMKKKATNEYRSFSAFDFRVHRGLARIAKRCLSLDRSGRFPDAASLLAALRQCHGSLSKLEPGQVMREFMQNPATTTAIFARRSIPGRALIAGAAALAAIVLAAGGFAVRHVRRQALSAPAPAVVTHQPPAVPPAPNDGLRPLAPPVVAATPAAVASSAQTPRAPAPAAATAGSKPPRPAPVRSVPAKKTVAPAPTSPLDQLKSKYAAEDPFAIGKAALAAKAYPDAALAFGAVPATHAQYAAAQVLLAETYLAAGRVGDAQKAAEAVGDMRDGALDIVRGRLAQNQSNIDRALDFYQSALLKPSVVKDVKEVRSDALYYTARIRTAQHSAAPSAESRLQALNAWLAVKKHHASEPSSARFREANAAMAEIQ